MGPRLTIGAAIAVLFFAATSAGAEGIYKWVDSQGRLHFGGTPPPGAKAQRLNTPPTADPAPGEGAARTWQEQLELSGQRKQLAQEQEQKARQDRQEYERRCLEARQALDTLNRERPIYRNNVQGEREYIDDNQRQAAREAANQRVATYCQ